MRARARFRECMRACACTRAFLQVYQRACVRARARARCTRAARPGVVGVHLPRARAHVCACGDGVARPGVDGVHDRPTPAEDIILCRRGDPMRRYIRRAHRYIHRVASTATVTVPLPGPSRGVPPLTRRQYRSCA